MGVYHTALEKVAVEGEDDDISSLEVARTVTEAQPAIEGI